MLVNVNDQWQGLEINYIWNMIMGMLVFLIIPGIGLLYGGMSKRKSSLAMLFQSLMVMGVVVSFGVHYHA
jgi:Amt family ammonium transporter